MSRVTAPVAKLSRALNAAPATHNAGAVIMPKYAELLRNRRGSEHTDSSRGMTTAHRPTPQPSIANRNKPLMQTFYSDASAVSSVPSSHLDASVLPFMGEAAAAAPEAGPRVPLMPDNYTAASQFSAADVSSSSSEATLVSMPQIVAVDPSRVNAMSDVEGIDGVNFGFFYEQQAAEQPKEESQQTSAMLKDLWKGMVDDVLGPSKKFAA
ncbi:hypothetical protein S40285_03615 [Stachybotrys chlorohalonatus IBT 40285]|uniref:Uncharacterized protein n=1 Tax=Stachybotrys chlorohalonatus (strain IBT 40285) TaxID=1283841 RepID=A0A084QBP8_STAC4|nr:hypothetical protein S40285_03615 [Stachybotrys chlorohalonata IBT 40285]